MSNSLVNSAPTQKSLPQVPQGPRLRADSAPIECKPKIKKTSVSKAHSISTESKIKIRTASVSHKPHTKLKLNHNDKLATQWQIVLLDRFISSRDTASYQMLLILRGLNPWYRELVDNFLNQLLRQEYKPKDSIAQGFQILAHNHSALFPPCFELDLEKILIFYFNAKRNSDKPACNAFIKLFESHINKLFDIVKLAILSTNYDLQKRTIPLFNSLILYGSKSEHLIDNLNLIIKDYLELIPKTNPDIQELTLRSLIDLISKGFIDHTLIQEYNLAALAGGCSLERHVQLAAFNLIELLTNSKCFDLSLIKEFSLTEKFIKYGFQATEVNAGSLFCTWIEQLPEKSKNRLLQKLAFGLSPDLKQDSSPYGILEVFKVLLNKNLINQDKVLELNLIQNLSHIIISKVQKESTLAFQLFCSLITISLVQEKWIQWIVPLTEKHRDKLLQKLIFILRLDLKQGDSPYVIFKVFKELLIKDVINQDNQGTIVKLKELSFIVISGVKKESTLALQILCTLVKKNLIEKTEINTEFLLPFYRYGEETANFFHYLLEKAFFTKLELMKKIEDCLIADSTFKHNNTYQVVSWISQWAIGTPSNFKYDNLINEEIVKNTSIITTIIDTIPNSLPTEPTPYTSTSIIGYALLLGKLINKNFINIYLFNINKLVTDFKTIFYQTTDYPQLKIIGKMRDFNPKAIRLSIQSLFTQLLKNNLILDPNLIAAAERVVKAIESTEASGQKSPRIDQRSPRRTGY